MTRTLLSAHHDRIVSDFPIACSIGISERGREKGDITNIDNCCTAASSLGHLSIFVMSPFPPISPFPPSLYPPFPPRYVPLSPLMTPFSWTPSSCLLFFFPSPRI